MTHTHTCSKVQQLAKLYDASYIVSDKSRTRAIALIFVADQESKFYQTLKGELDQTKISIDFTFSGVIIKPAGHWLGS